VRTILVFVLMVISGFMSSISGLAQNKILYAQFTTAPIVVDGTAEAVWDKATPSHIGIAMNPRLTAITPECTTSGDVRALWYGSLLYLLLRVTDSDVTTTSGSPINRDGVEIYIDLWNDKVGKYEEDDGIMRISAPPASLSGSGSQNTIFPAIYVSRLKAYASAAQLNAQGVQTGYTVELAFNIGGVAMKNGSSLGIEFAINDADSATQTRKCRVYWNNGNNRGNDDNSIWGTVTLSGYDAKTSMPPDSFMLSQNIAKAEALVRGIWTSENKLDQALAAARKALTAKKQSQMDAANAALDGAIKALRRKGRYPDPLDLPKVDYLPDPFKFQDGRKVKSPSDWAERREEIKDLAQYYEYGTMPPPPEAVTATATGSPDNSTLSVMVQDKGRSASFNARLTVPTAAQCGRAGPYPVIVSIDFFAAAGNATYINAGYAVLSFTYSNVASDNTSHTGAFYSLYPYNVATGNDAGVLLGWAWGASRSVDALHYLAKNNPPYANLLDLKKLVVTGFSRCGKAALLAGLMDERFGVVNPGGSGSGGAAAYRYDSYGNTPYRHAPFGNVYPWGTSSGSETLGDHVRHQTHNSNEMLARFLDPDRMYKTRTHGYGERLPYDHHEIIAAIAPRAVIIDTSNDDYSNNAEGDSIGYEGAKPVYAFLGAVKNLAFNIRTTGGGHSLSAVHRQNVISFCNMVFYGTPLPEPLRVDLYDNPYIDTYDRYYGGLKTMMPWK
jgi:endo-1,4-beta-xylanase